jgi:hypothetical protein
MTDLIIKIVRFSHGPRSSIHGTELQDSNAKYIPDTAIRSGTKRPVFGTLSCESNRGTYNASVSAENGQWQFPNEPSLFGIEKTVVCEVEAEESEATMKDVINNDAHGRRLGGA